MASESAKARRERAAEIVRRLRDAYPGTAAELCALVHDSAYQLLVATILSAQCTDERVNMVTPALFRRYPDPAGLAAARPEDVEEMIRSTGFFRAKSRHLLGMASALVERFAGEVPQSMEDLVTLPGVGRKTASVVRSVALDLPGLPVDTHVLRLSRRLGLTSSADPDKVEADLCSLLPEAEWGAVSLRLILHGRKVCVARRPRCEDCVLAGACPTAGLGELGAARAFAARPARGGKPATTAEPGANRRPGGGARMSRPSVRTRDIPG